MKEKVLEILNRKHEETVAEVQALEETTPPDEEKEALRQQVAALELQVADLNSKLVSVDQLAKQIDASIEDAPQA